MVNSKSSDFVLYKMMQDFKNDLLYHFLNKFKLEYFDFGIINQSDIYLGHQRALIFDNAMECLPITFLQNQKINLFLFLSKYFKDIPNGVITKTHYVKRDVLMSETETGSYEYYEFVMKYNFSNENEQDILKTVSLFLDNLNIFLLNFKNQHLNKTNYRFYQTSPNYLFNKLNNYESKELSIIKNSAKFTSNFENYFDLLTDDKNQSVLVSFYDKKKMGHLDLVYFTPLVFNNVRFDENNWIESELSNYVIDEIKHMASKHQNIVYFQLNLTNLIYYFFNCDNIQEVEPCYLTKKLFNKYEKKNINFKENY